MFLLIEEVNFQSVNSCLDDIDNLFVKQIGVILLVIVT